MPLSRLQQRQRNRDAAPVARTLEQRSGSMLSVIVRAAIRVGERLPKGFGGDRRQDQVTSLGA